jgi:hypothetical protein
MDQEPQCKCGKVMTRQNSTIAPEYFLCDDCARTEAHGLDNIRFSLEHNPGTELLASVLENAYKEWHRLGSPTTKKSLFVAMAEACYDSGYPNDIGAAQESGRSRQKDT